MINAVGAANTKNVTFADDNAGQMSANPYWILTGENKGDEFIPAKYRKYKIVKRIGEGVVAAGIIATGAALIAINGGPKALGKYAKKLSQYLDKNIQKAKLQNEKVSVFRIILQKTADASGARFEAVNNFNTIKDYSLKQFLFTKEGLPKGIAGRIHAKITSMFEKIAQRTVLNSYQNTGSKFSRIMPSVKNAENSVGIKGLQETAEIGGITKTKKLWLEDQAEKNGELLQMYNSSFSKIQTGKRFYNFKNAALESIKNYFGEKGFFWFVSKDTLNTFAAQNAVEAQRLIHKQKLNAVRNSISYSYSDLAKNASDIILKITHGISNKDNEKLINIISIEKEFKILGRTQSFTEAEKIRTELVKKLTAFEKSLKENELPIETKNELKSLISMLSSFKEGKIQEILKIYKNILPQNEYVKLEKIYKDSVKSLDKSIGIETEDYTAKIRDLSLGSAPTDIISIVGGFITLGYFLAKSENNDKRISVSLKYGIPALTTIGTVTYANTRLFAGSKSMALAAASGFVTGKICGYLNEKFLARVQKRKADAARLNA